MFQIKIKPLSVNEAYRGRRYKTPKYKAWRTAMGFMLPNIDVPKGRLSLTVEFGFSSIKSDLDNPVKALQDSLSENYGFNDKMIYELHVKKHIVAPGDDYIRFRIDSLDDPEITAA